MNQQLIKTYLNSYKANFSSISTQELYKWKAVKQFQDHWDIEAEDFYGMLETSLSKVKNLMESSNYYPKRMILRNAEVAPEKIRLLFKELYNEDDDIVERINSFQKQIIDLTAKNFKGESHYHYDRAMVAYLALKYPDRYFFYKYGMFKDFTVKVDYAYSPIRGRIENVTHYESLCENIKYLVSQDQELLRLHNKRLTADCYIDKSLNILTQDFIYAVAQHLNEQEVTTVKEVSENVIQRTTALDITVSSSNVSFNPSIINHIQNNKENKHIGDLGELFVIQFEREKLRKANKPKLVKKVAHHAKDKGDGLGYDVLSYDEAGNKMYIEVKATKGNKNSPFFITRNELERSKQEEANFFIYRVYNFNDETMKGDVLVIQGDVSSLCVEAVNYKVKMD